MTGKHISSIIALFALTTSACFGFGNDGHRIVGAIAQSYLSEPAANEVKALLGTATLADVSTWADEIRGNPRYFFAKPLHYINVPRNATAIDEDRDCASGACVTSAIRKYNSILRDHSRSTAERIEALKFVVHFVGDIHQPLHVSYKDDQGGNGVKLKWLNADWSLHSLWDTGLLNNRRGAGTWQRVSTEIQQKITGMEQTNWSASSDPILWANESLQITRRIYAELPADHKVTQAYYRQNIGLLEKQLATAGVRLANLLNDALAPSLELTTATTTSSTTLTICTFNVQFLGQSSARDDAALADIVKDHDIVVVQELIAPPYSGKFPNGEMFKPDPDAARFFDAMRANGFGYVLSEEDTGKGPRNHLNSTATEWWVVFFKSNRVDYATDLPRGFLDSDRTAHPEFDRVPYAFSFRSKNRKADFVLISVHLRPGSGMPHRARRIQELGAIARWIDTNDNVEKDFIILGDMNLEDIRDLTDATPSGMISLNSRLEPTNTNVNGPKPYDHVMFNPSHTKEIDQEFGFKVIGLVERMKDYWSRPAPYPGDEPYHHDNFRKYYTDHNPVVFRLKANGPDDD